MSDLSYLWLFAMPVVPFCLVICWLSDTFETPRHERDLECRAAIVQAIDSHDVEEVRHLLRKWERIRPDIHSPRTAQVTLSITTMTDADKLALVRRIVEEAIKVEEQR